MTYEIEESQSEDGLKDERHEGVLLIEQEIRNGLASLIPKGSKTTAEFVETASGPNGYVKSWIFRKWQLEEVVPRIHTAGEPRRVMGYQWVCESAFSLSEYAVERLFNLQQQNCLLAKADFSTDS